MDVIDKRNIQEKMAKSVIKRRNVVYTTPEKQEQNEPVKEAQEEEVQVINPKAQEILDRLEQEHLADERKKREELERLIAEQEMKHQEAMQILAEKRANLEKTMDSARHEMEE